MHLLRILEQSRPVSLTELFLLQHELHGARRVMRFRRGGVNFGVELKRDGVFRLLRLGVTGEGQLARLQIELDLLRVDVDDCDGEEDVVLFGLAGG